ncbi:hypothetical protein AVEN_153628-1 [Araneus ventricosus]|uniref:Uncharacterized protein n=1 Tax=Araneus ventricosus TaxID=182803 RepID=A0A4Y2BQ87_ARAVE|nr:hypothetical protein AVEN_153628-1 [Araneus ventricosus]
MDLAILNRGGMTRMMPELAHPPQNFCTIPVEGRLTYVRFSVNQVNKHGGSLIEPGFEYGALRLRSRDLTTKPPRYSNCCCVHADMIKPSESEYDP